MMKQFYYLKLALIVLTLSFLPIAGYGYSLFWSKDYSEGYPDGQVVYTFDRGASLKTYLHMSLRDSPNYVWKTVGYPDDNTHSIGGYEVSANNAIARMVIKVKNGVIDGEPYIECFKYAKVKMTLTAFYRYNPSNIRQRSIVLDDIATDLANWKGSAMQNLQVQDRSAIGVEEYIEKIYTIKHRGDWGREAPKISCT